MAGSLDEKEERKRTIFNAMSRRQRERILARGYENWDPFEPPQDPVDLRVEGSRHTAAELTTAFLKERGGAGSRGPGYRQGVWEVCVGILNSRDRYIGMYEFCCWYRDFLKRKGIE